MRVTQRRGKIRLRVEPIEAALLARMLTDLTELLAVSDDEEPDPEAESDPVRARLNPSGYRGDIDAQREFRAMTGNALEAERNERIEQCRTDLEAAAAGGGLVELDESGGDRWLRILNDLRLALGTRLGVAEDDDPLLADAPSLGADDADDADEQGVTYGREVYVWLTAVQDSLVHAVTR